MAVLLYLIHFIGMIDAANLVGNCAAVGDPTINPLCLMDGSEE